jgi:plastocyanin
MKLRRAVSGFAVAALVSTLAACGGGDEAAPVAQEAPAAAAGADAAAAPAAAGGVDAMAGNSAPGTGADAYAADDPFVGTKEVKAVPGTIIMQTFAFTPKKITSKPGQVWKIENQDIAIHDVRTTDKAKTIFSGDVSPSGGKGTVKMPTKPGKYKAVCFYHQSMELDVTVKK